MRDCVERRGSIECGSVDGLSLAQRFTIVRLTVRGLRSALDASTARLDALASQYEGERETARGLLSDLHAWCSLAEQHALALARLEEP